MLNLKQLFIWWHSQTFGTFLETIFFGKLVGKDENGNKFYKNKNDKRWVIYRSGIEASKINSDWYLWIHHTVNDIPTKRKKFLWQKDHKPNQTGTSNSYKPSKISKKNNKKKYGTWNG